MRIINNFVATNLFTTALLTTSLLTTSLFTAGLRSTALLMVKVAVVLVLVSAFWSQPVFADSAAATAKEKEKEQSAIESPVALLERTSQQVIKILRDDRELLKKDPDRVYKIIDDYILPHLDQVTMAKLALGKNWKKASKQQKIDFVAAFRDLLIRTYSKSLVEFKDQDIRYFPVRLQPGVTKTSVKAEVIQPGGPSIPLAYRMRVKNNAWKVYDIKIDGISLVTSYRGTFTQEVRKSGIDGLLKYLSSKKHGGDNKQSSHKQSSHSQSNKNQNKISA